MYRLSKYAMLFLLFSSYLWAAGTDTLKAEKWEGEAKWRISGENYTATVEIDWPVSGPAQVVNAVKKILENHITERGDGEDYSGFFDVGWNKNKQAFQKAMTKLGKKLKSEGTTWPFEVTSQKGAEYDDVIFYDVYERPGGECPSYGYYLWGTTNYVISKENGQHYKDYELINLNREENSIVEIFFGKDSLHIEYFPDPYGDDDPMPFDECQIWGESSEITVPWSEAGRLLTSEGKKIFAKRLQPKASSNQAKLSAQSNAKQGFATVTIGNQTWMAKDLDNEVAESYCYDNQLVCQFSRLYTFSAAQNVCPEGWRLPNKNDILTLAKNTKGRRINDCNGTPGLICFEGSGNALKDQNKWVNGNGGSNSTGFSAIATGYRSEDGFYDELGGYGYFWVDNDGESWAFSFEYNSDRLNLGKGNPYEGYAVRCIKDEGNYGKAQSYNKNQDNFAPAAKTATQKKTYVSDDDDEYENDDYDYAPTAKSVGKKNSYADDEDIDYVAANTDSEPKDDTPPVTLDEFYETPLHWGLHLAIGYAGTWKNEEVVGMFDPYSYQYSMADPFKGFMGINADIGLVVNYHLTNMFSLVGELNVRILEYFKESEVWYLSLGYYGTAPLDENMLLVDLSVPLLFRVNPRPNFYLEAGLQLNLNVYGAFTLSNEEYDYEEDMGEWKGQSNGWGIVLGAGVTLPLKTIFADIGGRIVLDMTRLEADQMVYNGASNTFRMPTATRAWAIQFTINTYL